MTVAAYSNLGAPHLKKLSSPWVATCKHFHGWVSWRLVVRWYGIQVWLRHGVGKIPDKLAGF
jgi:hypothetical protein